MRQMVHAGYRHLRAQAVCQYNSSCDSLDQQLINSPPVCLVLRHWFAADLCGGVLAPYWRVDWHLQACWPGQHLQQTAAPHCASPAADCMLRLGEQRCRVMAIYMYVLSRQGCLTEGRGKAAGRQKQEMGASVNRQNKVEHPISIKHMKLVCSTAKGPFSPTDGNVLDSEP